MRLGGPLPQNYSDPDSWIAALKERGYRAAYCPVEQRDSMVDAYVQAARDADVLIAEVGAWSNPLSPDGHERRKAIDYCQQRLALAEAIGALSSFTRISALSVPAGSQTVHRRCD